MAERLTDGNGESTTWATSYLSAKIQAASSTSLEKTVASGAFQALDDRPARRALSNNSLR
jgi:hypothetical protein